MLARLYSYLPLAAVLVIAVITRFIFLESVPGAITGDELTYIINARLIGLTGSGIDGITNLISLFTFANPAAFIQSELPYLLVYLPVNTFGFSLFTTRMLFALMSVGVVIMIYLLVKNLIDTKVALIAAALAAINPWQIFIGRTSYESTPAAFFYLAATLVLLKAKSWQILLSFPLFLLAFYSYIGTKVSFVPLIIAVSVFAYLHHKKKYARYYLILNAAAVLFVAFFASSLLSQGGGRTSELFTPFSGQVSEQVDVFRRQSLAPEFINKVFENKFVVFSRIVIAKILNVFSPNYLFFQSDNFVNMIRHGLFYPLDAIFLVIGVIALYIKKKALFVGLFALIFASILPEIFYTDRINIFSPHLTLFLAFLIVPIAYGVNYLLSFDKRSVVVKGVIVLYLFFIANFFYIYFFQFPVAGHFDFSSRLLSSYLARNEGIKIDAYVKKPVDAYKKYIYYSDLLNRSNAEEIKKSINSGSFTVGDITFLECGKIGASIETESLAIYQTDLCQIPEDDSQPLLIGQLADSGEVYRIYNDSLCSRYDLGTYVSDLSFSNLNIEELSEKDFCKSYILR